MSRVVGLARLGDDGDFGVPEGEGVVSQPEATSKEVRDELFDGGPCVV